MRLIADHFKVDFELWLIAFIFWLIAERLIADRGGADLMILADCRSTRQSTTMHLPFDDGKKFA
jgi:hypothetical protein